MFVFNIPHNIHDVNNFVNDSSKVADLKTELTIIGVIIYFIHL